TPIKQGKSRLARCRATTSANKTNEPAGKFNPRTGTCLSGISSARKIGGPDWKSGPLDELRCRANHPRRTKPALTQLARSSLFRAPASVTARLINFAPFGEEKR